MLLFILFVFMVVNVATQSVLDIDDNFTREFIENGWYVPQLNGSFVWMDFQQAYSMLHDLEQAEDKEELFNKADVKPPSIRYFLYTRQNPSKAVEITPDSNDSALNTSPFNPNHPTRMIIHGWTQSHESELNMEIRDAWLGLGNYNIIVVDWEKARRNTYVTSVVPVPKTGVQVGEMIRKLQKEHGLRLNTLHLIGHSLGAHIAGIAGKTIRGIHTIVGLDPAGPLFSYSNEKKRITYKDAYYVETIHTNAGRLGYQRPLGRAAFYPNGGKKQPGCGRDLIGTCSHKRSTQFYAEAIAKNNFVAHACPNIEAALDSDCDNSFSGVRMASPSNAATADGIFYVPVGPESPYASIS